MGGRIPSRSRHVRHDAVAMARLISVISVVCLYDILGQLIEMTGHSRALKLVPFENLGVVSYLPSIVTGAILYRLRDIATNWSKIAKRHRIGGDPGGIS